MSEDCSVLIAAAELMQALKARAGNLPGELLMFTDTDAPHAVELILRRHPGVVAIDRTFADTPRGAALIARIRADPTLVRTAVHILSDDGAPSDAVPQPTMGVQTAATSVATVPAPVVVAAPRELDERGTRRSPRFTMAGGVEALIDGNTVTLIDLSTVGAQVISATILRPNQRVRTVLSDEQATLRLNASVAWASFEIAPRGGVHYRAGIEFVGADAAAVDAYCARHRE